MAHPPNQTLEEILEKLKSLEVDWRDETSRRVIKKITKICKKPSYDKNDLAALFDDDFSDAILVCRLFVGQSKDQFTAAVKAKLGMNGSGIKRYQAEQEVFINALIELGVTDSMAREINKVPHWSDTLVERLRSGRGSAVSGQLRGRDAEDFVETVVKSLFKHYDSRCNFVGIDGKTAKCDFAIPSKHDPLIIIESKAYGATGSKMSDVLGDIKKILGNLKRNTHFLFFTDGLPWIERQSDLKKIVEHQNAKEIYRIYTYAMENCFRSDLIELRDWHKLEAPDPEDSNNSANQKIN